MLRNNNNFVTVPRRTQLYSKSFIPSAVSEWNNLDDDIKNSSTLSIFKYKLKQKFKSAIVPSQRDLFIPYQPTLFCLEKVH